MKKYKLPKEFMVMPSQNQKNLKISIKLNSKNKRQNYSKDIKISDRKLEKEVLKSGANLLR